MKQTNEEFSFQIIQEREKINKMRSSFTSKCSGKNINCVKKELIHFKPTRYMRDSNLNSDKIMNNWRALC